MNRCSLPRLAALTLTLPMLALAQTKPRPEMPGPDAPAASCNRLPEMAKPALEFRGQVHIQTTMKVEGGRVTMMEFKSMTGGIPRKELRRLTAEIHQHVSDRYVCETDGRLQKDFKFNYE